jgi:hypothetical protein
MDRLRKRGLAAPWLSFTAEPVPSGPDLVGSDFLSWASFSEQEANRALVPFPASFTDFHDPTRFGRQGNGNISLVNGNNSIHSI